MTPGDKTYGEIPTPGEAVHDLARRPWSQITLQLDYPGLSSRKNELPIAFGNLYLFEDAFPTGLTPYQLQTNTASQTTNFLGEATANSNNTEYVFSSSIQLTAGHTYYFFSDVNPGADGLSITTATETSANTNTSQVQYIASGGLNSGVASKDAFQAHAATDNNLFQLSGVVVPEPSPLALLVSGAVARLECGHAVTPTGNYSSLQVDPGAEWFLRELP